MQAQTEAICQMNGNGSGFFTNSITPLNPQYAGLFEFHRNNPLFFYGCVDPMEVEEWLQQLEKIFKVMKCDDAQKVDFATYMLESNVEHRWNNARGSLANQGASIT